MSKLFSVSMKIVMLAVILALTVLQPGAALANAGVLAIEREFAQYFVECGAGFRNGQMLFARCGNGGAWNPYFNINDNEQASIASGGMFTHNHPNACFPLSKEDVQAAIRLNLLEIRSVALLGNTLYVSSLSRRGAQWPAIDFNGIGYSPTLQDPNGIWCSWPDQAWRRAAQLYPLSYNVYQEQFKQ